MGCLYSFLVLLILNIFIINKMVSFILEDSIEKGLSTFNTHHKWQSPTTQYHTTIFKETKETERY